MRYRCQRVIALAVFRCTRTYAKVSSTLKRRTYSDITFKMDESHVELVPRVTLAQVPGASS